MWDFDIRFVKDKMAMHFSLAMGLKGLSIRQ